MSDIKLVLTDIDGTIVPIHSHKPSKAVRDTIVQLKRSGVRLTAATGRPYGMARKLFIEVGLTGLNIFDAGASIRDTETGKFAWKNWLGVRRLESIAEILIPHANMVDFFPGYQEVPPGDISSDKITEEAPYAWGCVPNDRRDEVLKQLDKLSGLSIHVDAGLREYPDSCNIQITDRNADKYHAVRALKEIAHSRIDETLAIGDSSNDMPLFDSAGLKIAMGNASSKLKEAADHTVASVDEDGFTEAMNRFVL